ncbi:UPF0716 protein FxsA [Desulfotomaculum arcticum]|uniref:UPF0716 protein FxsA n=1 Tax=Desulfotruncus arcticus DSM 17038 TaxID=1121424 RepID=A0A1I2VV40_9FIRM|nr:UPF0716 protein FxsA [Desulfotomaculum arcticum] [Desulfotruncus arcticus DSM 17038]
MLSRLFLLFVLVPFLELIILIRIGQYLGFLPTVFILLALGLLGIALVRTQGFQVWHRIRTEVSAGRPPGEALLDGLLVFSAGLLLITPGLLTDAAGLLLLLPPVRAAARLRLAGWLLKQLGNRLRWR